MPLYIIRHGETDSNRERIVQTPQTPLSVLGQQQARQLAQRFLHVPISKIICSDYLRTQQTAAPIVQQFKCAIEYSALLRERNLGDLRGLSYDDIADDFHHENYVPKNGESYEQFSLRVAQAWRFVLQQCEPNQDPIIVMTHGLVLRELVRNHLYTNDPSQLAQATYQNTSVIEVDIKDKKTIVALCDVSHLTTDSAVNGGIA